MATASSSEQGRTWCGAHWDAQGCSSVNCNIVMASCWLDDELQLRGALDCLFVNKACGWYKHICIGHLCRFRRVSRQKAS